MADCGSGRLRQLQTEAVAVADCGRSYSTRSRLTDNTRGVPVPNQPPLPPQDCLAPASLTSPSPPLPPPPGLPSSRLPEFPPEPEDVQSAYLGLAEQSIMPYDSTLPHAYSRVYAEKAGGAGGQAGWRGEGLNGSAG